MFLWYWKFSITALLVLVALLTTMISTNASIDSMEEMNRLFAFGGVTILVWCMETLVNVVNHLRKES